MRKIALLGGVVFLFLLVSCRQTADELNTLGCDGCNIVMISLSGARLDHLSTYGHDKNTSPHISGLAEHGVKFTNAFTHASKTTPAHVSLLTSQYPYTHGITDRWHTKKDLDPNSKTMAEILRKNGYKTAAFVGSSGNNGALGFDNGFDVYEDIKEKGFVSNVAGVVEWLGQNKDNKFFLLLQSPTSYCINMPPSPYDTIFDVGYENTNNIDFSGCYFVSPYEDEPVAVVDGVKKYSLVKTDRDEWDEVTKGEEPKVLFDERDLEHLGSLHDGSIGYADSQIGEILKSLTQLGLDDNTIIVFTSDHGKLIGDNGRFSIGAHLTGGFYDDVLHIPLVIKYPNMNAMQINGLVQIIDINPTLLESLGIPNYEASQGRSLSPLIVSGIEV